MTEHLDLPRLDALTRQWNKPAAGAAADPGAGSAAVEEAAEFVPVNRSTAEEFDAMLRGFGLPVDAPKNA